MNPIRVFAAMTAPHVDQDSCGRSTNPLKFDQATAAGMCRGMPDLAFKAAMYKWSGDGTYRTYLMYRLMVEGAGIAAAEGWSVPRGGDLLRKMATLALNELASPGAWRNGVSKATYLGISKHRFYRTWRKRYESIFRVLDGWAYDGYRYVQRKNTDI